MLNPAEPYLSTHSAAAPSDPQKAVQASLGLARHYIAHGNTTAALQVGGWSCKELVLLHRL